MTTSSKHLLLLVPALAKRKDLSWTFEHSSRLAWLIVRGNSGAELTVTYYEGRYHMATKDTYLHAGYIHSLTRTRQTRSILKFIFLYFAKGYQAVLHAELKLRCKDQGKGISLEELKRKLSKMLRQSKLRKTPPLSLEFPPSLAETIKDDSPCFKRLKATARQKTKKAK